MLVASPADAGAPRVPAHDRDRLPARDRDPLVPADRPRLRDERRCVHRRARESRHAPSLVAAAALLTDYVLTVAVSISAGIFAITSFAPSLAPTGSGFAACLLVIVLANLRGVRESGLLFALPTYAFIAAILAVDVVGLFELATGNLHHAVVPNPLPAGTGPSRFSSSCARSRRARPRSPASRRSRTASTRSGIRRARTRRRRSRVLGGMTITMFIGLSFLAVHVHALPSATDSVVSRSRGPSSSRDRSAASCTTSCRRRRCSS